MTRARYRAFKCRQGVHRRGEDSCRDCHKPFGFSIRWVKQWDVQLDPSPTFVRYILPDFAGRINADGSFTPAPTTDPMDPTGTLLRRKNVQIGPPGWH